MKRKSKSLFNRRYKDSLFRFIFGRNDEKSQRWRLDLYNALNDSHYTDPDALEVTTIEDVIYISMKNDLSFLIDNVMNLYEHQSTYNPNMPLRGLLYFSQLYQTWLTKNQKDLFSSKLVQIPCPQYIVFYNGIREMPEVSTLRLSDAFSKPDKTGTFEWSAKVININQGKNKSLPKNCKALYDYISYTARVRSNLETGMKINDAITEAVDWAVDEDLLEGFFKEQKAKVEAMSLTEFDEELFIKTMHQDGYEDGYADGREEGARANALENARNLLKNGVSPEIIAKSIGLEMEEVLKLNNHLRT